MARLRRVGSGAWKDSQRCLRKETFVRKTHALIAAATTAALTLSGCTSPRFKQCTELPQAQQAACYAQDAQSSLNSGYGGGAPYPGYRYGGFVYYGPRALSDPNFSGTRADGSVGGFGSHGGRGGGD